MQNLKLFIIQYNTITKEFVLNTFNNYESLQVFQTALITSNPDETVKFSPFIFNDKTKRCSIPKVFDFIKVGDYSVIFGNDLSAVYINQSNPIIWTSTNINFVDIYLFRHGLKHSDLAINIPNTNYFDFVLGNIINMFGSGWTIKIRGNNNDNLIYESNEFAILSSSS